MKRVVQIFVDNCLEELDSIRRPSSRLSDLAEYFWLFSSYRIAWTERFKKITGFLDIPKNVVEKKKKNFAIWSRY